MITPDFTGHHVRSQPAFDQSVEHQQLSGTLESRKHDKRKPKGHILIEKHGHGRRSYGEKSPHSRRREMHKNLQGQSRPLSSPTKQQLELSKELCNVNEKLGLCYDELKSGYMRGIARDVGLNTVDSGMFTKLVS